ncbi:trans-sialidase, putative [Trypanosoma cruzi]|uniref:Trans-sialidase, putative n=2 Tax=Trypanosoma cruzi TaxID=5693 RepID=Q4E4Y6_TRYCC|nr:trans-sialidase, putative [Trypanosoma cruzi]EAN99826.1 trans-sialidase, putative [Trypanosoma cruzi]|eukprot:XP_821677.1 trans-sialidase [Trypanosoma cruzi strain CL Brener]
MLSRVAAVKAPRTHNRRCVTGSRGRRREGRESERQRPNMSRRVFTSAVLLLLVVLMCGTGGAVKAAEPASGQGSLPKSPFDWRDTKDEETVSSLRVPVLVEVNGGVFAVAEAQCTKDGVSFTGIASQLLTNTADNKPKEVLEDAKEKPQVLEEDISTEKKKVDVSRPTVVVSGNNIYMLVGKHSHEDAANCQAGTENIKSGMLLVKGELGEADKKIDWKTTDGVPCTLGEKHESLSQLIGGGGSGVKLTDDTLLFPVEATKNVKDGRTKTVSLIIYTATTSWNLSKGMSADGCGDPSVVEWKGKLMMMTACDDGRRRVYESGDKGDSWTEALGTLSRVWGNDEGNVWGVRSGFITAALGVEDDKRNVMLVTLPVYSKEEKNGKGVLHLWLTDNTHIVDIGPVSGEDDVAASSLLYKSGDNNEEKLIALYEKKGGEGSSLGMVSVLLTEQLKRVKDVLATWKEVDGRVSKLCPTLLAEKDESTENACSTTVKITAGLVGFLSGNFSDNTWRDEYFGVNATVTNKDLGVEKTENGITFKGRGAWAEWPVGSQGENQLYHFANYNFTLLATVSIHGVPESGSHIPLIGAKMNDSEKTVLVGLSYNNKEKKWILLCDGGENKEHSSHLGTENSEHVVILLRNGNQSSAYVGGKRVCGNVQRELKNTDPKEISHFYIGGDGGSAEGQEGVSVTVTNVLLYNRPLTEEEVGALNPNKAPITSPVTENAPETVLQPPAKPQPSEHEPLTTNIGAGGVPSAASTATTPSSDVDPTVATGGGDTMRGNESPQTPEVSASSGEDRETAGITDAQGEEDEIHPQAGELNATALNSSLGHLSQGNNSDGGTMRESRRLPSLLLLLGLWGFAAL